MWFLARLLINAAALWIATEIVPGVTQTGPWTSLLLVALVFGLLNALVRPILKLLTCPLIVLTLGLFTFVINAVVLWLTSASPSRSGWDSTWKASCRRSWAPSPSRSSACSCLWC